MNDAWYIDKRCDCTMRAKLRQTGWAYPQATAECPSCGKKYYEQQDGTVTDKKPAVWPGSTKQRPKYSKMEYNDTVPAYLIDPLVRCSMLGSTEEEIICGAIKEVLDTSEQIQNELKRAYFIS